MNHVPRRLFGRLLSGGIGLLLLSSITPVAAQEATPAPTTLVDAVRQAVAPFPDPASAEAAGFVPMNGCVSSPQDGAMGMHYINPNLVGDGELDAAQPEALIYALHAGNVQFVGVEYLVLAEDWDAAHDGPPILMGQLFNLVGAPNRYRNPAFYELHVWAWKDNPNGTFADWHAHVTCDGVTGQ